MMRRSCSDDIDRAKINLLADPEAGADMLFLQRNGSYWNPAPPQHLAATHDVYPHFD